MKKLVLSTIIIFAALALNAQVASDSVLRSKKGIPILPQKGDFAIGVDALPYFSYFGNMFNNNNYNSLNVGDQTVYGRYYLSNNSALRLAVSIDHYSNLTSKYVQDDAAVNADPLSKAKTTDTYKYNNIGYYVDFGYLKFRGYGRLKGFYGASLGFGITKADALYTYGNPITVANSAPSSYVFNGGYETRLSTRTLEEHYGSTKTVSASLLAGVEYYFLPKICVGAEMSLSFASSWKGQGNSKTERLNNTVVVQENTADSPNGRTNTSLSTSEYSGGFGNSIYLIFHF